MLRIRTGGLSASLFDTAPKKRRAAGAVIVAILLILFVAFNRVPKLDTVRADLAVAASPAAECFQGFCIEQSPETTLLERWWDFSLTYLQLVSVGMAFAFLVAGATEAFLFPKSSGWGLSGSGFRGSLKGLVVGPAMTLCSACIVPVASAFRRRGAGVETTLAITQGSSTLNLPAIIMAAMVFAPLIGATRIALSIAGALLIGPLVAKIARDVSNGGFESVIPLATAPDGIGWGEALRDGFRDWARITASHVLRLAPVMILAGFASGLAIQWLSPQTVTTWLGDDIAGVAIAATIGVAINVPLLFEIPLVAALLLAGMGTAPAAALLFTAAAAGPITFWGLAKVMPKRAVVAYGAGVWALGVAGGLAALIIVSLGDGPDFGLRADYTTASHAAARAPEPASVISTVSNMRFTDVTRLAGIDYVHSPIPSLLGKTEPQYMVGGAVAEDFDGDGWIDLFALRGGDAPSALYMNRGDGTFSEEASERGAALPTTHGVAAAAADYDNDGDIDIVVAAQTAPHYLLVNDGAGRFSIDDSMLTQPEMFATSPSWGDVDNDGMLELALGEWNSLTAQAYDAATRSSGDLVAEATPNPIVGSSAKPLFLYRNDGNGNLEPYEFRVSPSADLWVFAPRFADMNGDGRADLAVVSDYGNTRLYINVGGGKFRLERSVSEVFTDENGMGSAIGDYDNDGDLDWFVSSIYGDGDPAKGVFGGTGNRLYRNDSAAGGAGAATVGAAVEFTDVSAGAGTRDGGWGWGASFGDLDNDGDLDLFHVNGWTQESVVGDPAEFVGASARLFENLGDGRFADVAAQTGADDAGQGRGAVLFDYDNDGDLDIFLTNNNGGGDSPAAPALLRNDTPTGNRWLKVTLDAAPPLHRHGIGSRIYVTAGGVTQMRELHASTGYIAQGPGRIAHFGLGDATVVDEVRVEWLDGTVDVMTGVAVDSELVVAK